MSISVISPGGFRVSKGEARYVKVYAWLEHAKLLVPRHGAGAFTWNGRVYLVGGIGRNGKPTSAVEWLDPATGEQGFASPMPEPRAHFAYAYINDKFYVIGGIDASSTPRDTIYSYDPASDTWEELPTKLPKGIAYSCATTLRVPGGRITIGIKPSSYGGTADYIMIYVDGRWLEAIPGTFRIENGIPKADFDASRLAGKTITRVGLHHTGMGWSDPTDVWIWDAAGNLLYHATATSHTWLTSFPNYFEYVIVDYTIPEAITKYRDVVVVTGGIDPYGNILADAYIVDVAIGVVNQLPAMNTARQNHACATLNGKVWVFGGDNGTQPLASTEVYDPTSDTWASGPDLPEPLTAIRALTTTLNGKEYILLVGG